MRLRTASQCGGVHEMDAGEKWLAKELELSQKHEELVLRREALLRGTERYHHHQENRSASFISDIKKAKERNEQLLGDLESSLAELRRVALDPGTPRFNTLKNNYYSMVKSVFPVWLDDLNQFEHRHKRSRSKSSGRRSPSSSPRLTGRRTPSPTLPTPRAKSPGSARLSQSHRPISTSPTLPHRSVTNTSPMSSPSNTLKSSLKSSMKTTTKSNRSR